MQIDEMVAGIDDEIARLQLLKALLGAMTTGFSPAVQSNTGRKTRTLNAKVRAKIAAAQKKRWAKQKRSAK